MTLPSPVSRFVLRMVLAALVSAMAMSASGCASKPTMKLKHAEISGMQLGFPPSVGVVLTVVLEVTNTNSYDVAVRAMRGTAIMADRYTLPIDYRPGGEGVWLSADNTTVIRVPVTVPVDLALRLLRESYTTPLVSFRVIGTADVTATRTFKIEKDNYSVDERGTFSRQQLEMAIPRF